MTEAAKKSHFSWMLSNSDQSKVRLPGTDRARDPEATLEMVNRVVRMVGITRIADITWLDTIGIPTFQAIRPTSRTVAVSQGKGITYKLAKISAIMESLELWHAEQPLKSIMTAPACNVYDQLSYDIRDLTYSVPTVFHDDLPMDWVVARSLIDGSNTLLPKDAVGFSFERKADWTPPIFLRSSNGLASGNTFLEATLHGLYEVIERDAIASTIIDGYASIRVNPRTLESPVVDNLCEMISLAQVSLEVRSLGSSTGVPCFLARITSDDYPILFRGYGCNLSSQIAITRAITEAAQARLAYISGSRDDLYSDTYTQFSSVRLLPNNGETIQNLSAHETLIDDLIDVVKRATIAFSCSPLVVDLTRYDIGVPVVRVVAPGSRIYPETI